MGGFLYISVFYEELREYTVDSDDARVSGAMCLRISLKPERN